MDIYAEITNRILSQMEQGIIPWQKPWVAAGKAVSYATGKPYSLLNQMLLGQPGEYATFKPSAEPIDCASTQARYFSVISSAAYSTVPFSRYVASG